DKADASRFIGWAEGAPLLASIGWARLLPYLLPPVTLGLFVAWRYDLLVYPLFWAGLALQAGVVALTRKPLGALYDLVSAGEGGFVRFERVFATLESRSFTHPRLVALRKGLETAGHPVSQRFKSFARLLAYAELRQSAQMHWAINLLLLWDLQWFFRLEAWRRHSGPQLRGWFQALYEVEALGSLAGFGHDHPDYPFPTLVPEGPRFEAKALGHPLLDRAVRNNVSLPGPSQALVVTGSNMSGKTTLLRAMGLNAVMAQAGLPVCASSMTCSQLSVLTSMRVKDSLERGVSYFYAEVQRMKAVLDAAEAAKGRALFLIDELLLGTNTRERQIASREVVRRLLETGACGAVTTHDLSLTELVGGPGSTVRNVHFRDQLADGKMSFDYLLRDGVVEGTNALRVLELAGIAIRGEERGSPGK
ncbi:MAG: MutS-related protein, partial [Myxococcaceae bacterium]